MESGMEMASASSGSEGVVRQMQRERGRVHAASGSAAEDRALCRQADSTMRCPHCLKKEVMGCGMGVARDRGQWHLGRAVTYVPVVDTNTLGMAVVRWATGS